MTRIAACLVAPLTLLHSGCSPLDVLNAITPARGYDRTAAIAYGDEPRQALDVYRPKGLAAPAPVVVFFYGGNWRDGDRADYRFVGQAMATRGYVCVIPDYRLYPAVTYPAFVADAALAVRWARDHAGDYGGDPARLFVMGHSAGAYLAAMVAVDPSYLAAVGMERDDIAAAALLAGPFDFLPLDDPFLSVVFGEHGDDPDAEPVTHVDGRQPPILLANGARDTTVDPANSDAMARRIENVGGVVRHVVYPKRGHVGVVLALAKPFRWLAPVLDDVTAFFAEHGASAGGGPSHGEDLIPAGGREKIGAPRDQANSDQATTADDHAHRRTAGTRAAERAVDPPRRAAPRARAAAGPPRRG